jgi:two-component system invasion response regulator UvrY
VDGKKLKVPGMLRILIADDHEIIRKGLKQILLDEFSLAYIEEASDGEFLVNKAMSGEWDIIISDIAMPAMNGIQALRRIKALLPKMPILLLSIHPEELYTDRILKLGASGYISKESATEKLINVVQKILEAKRILSTED